MWDREPTQTSLKSSFAVISVLCALISPWCSVHLMQTMQPYQDSVYSERTKHPVIWIACICWSLEMQHIHTCTQKSSPLPSLIAAAHQLCQLVAVEAIRPVLLTLLGPPQSPLHSSHFVGRSLCEMQSPGQWSWCQPQNKIFRWSRAQCRPVRKKESSVRRIHERTNFDPFLLKRCQTLPIIQ